MCDKKISENCLQGIEREKKLVHTHFKIFFFLPRVPYTHNILLFFAKKIYKYKITETIEEEEEEEEEEKG